MGYIDIESYYNLMFMLRQHHGWTTTEIGYLLPYERDIYVMLLKNHLEAMEKQQKASQK